MGTISKAVSRYSLAQDPELRTHRHHALRRHLDALHEHREHVSGRGPLHEDRPGGGVDARPVDSVRRLAGNADLPGEAVGGLEADGLAGAHVGHGDRRG